MAGLGGFGVRNVDGLLLTEDEARLLAQARPEFEKRDASGRVTEFDREGLANYLEQLGRPALAFRIANKPLPNGAFPPPKPAQPAALSQGLLSQSSSSADPGPSATIRGLMSASPRRPPR